MVLIEVLLGGSMGEIENFFSNFQILSALRVSGMDCYA
jgi:hypothetical protein